jgi:hypothetical protein
MSEPEPGILEGRVFTRGVAQETVRDGAVTRIKLTCMPGWHATRIPFPEPVQVAAGETVMIELEVLPG